MFKLIENEVIKMIFKKRLLVVLGILFVVISIFAYGENHSLERNKDRLSRRAGVSVSDDWKKLAEQQIIDLKSRLDSPYAREDSKASTRVRIEQLKYHIDNNINPIDSSAAKFTSRFMTQSIFLLLPLLIIVLSGDIVSGEAANGTIKLLLARNVPRWKILLSKYLALIILEVIILFFALVFSTAISGIFFGYGGWMAPVATGFKAVGDTLDTSGVLNVAQWQYLLMVYGLAYFVSIVIGTITFMISIMVRSTSASIGIMMSSLVGGSFMSFFLSDWKITRYMFMVNLRLTDYLSGSFQPIEGMNMAFSVSVLAVWAAAALIIGFTYFIKQDILV